jgi:hypothetical protein
VALAVHELTLAERVARLEKVVIKGRRVVEITR